MAWSTTSILPQVYTYYCVNSQQQFTRCKIKSRVGGCCFYGDNYFIAWMDQIGLCCSHFSVIFYFLDTLSTRFEPGIELNRILVVVGSCDRITSRLSMWPSANEFPADGLINWNNGRQHIKKNRNQPPGSAANRCNGWKWRRRLLNWKILAMIVSDIKCSYAEHILRRRGEEFNRWLRYFYVVQVQKLFIFWSRSFKLESI